MGFSINTHPMRSLQTYEAAHEFFTTTRKPRSARWRDIERPLRDTRSTHLLIKQIHHGGVDGYDLCLYNTPLIRYYKPNEQGERAVWLANHYSQSSQKFLWHNRWFSGKRIMTTMNTEVHIMISMATQKTSIAFDDTTGFTTRLILDDAGRLIQHRSAALPVFKKVTTQRCKETRAKIRKALELVGNVLDIKYHELDNTVAVSGQWWVDNGRLPKCDYHTEQRALAAMRELARWDVSAEDEVFLEELPALIEYGVSTYFKTAQELSVHRFSNNMTYAERCELEGQGRQLLLGDLQTMRPDFYERIKIKQGELRSKTLSYLLDRAGIKTNDGYEMLPMFPPAGSLPYHRKIVLGWTREFSSSDISHDICNQLLARKEVY